MVNPINFVDRGYDYSVVSGTNGEILDGEYSDEGYSTDHRALAQDLTLFSQLTQLSAKGMNYATQGVNFENSTLKHWIESTKQQNQFYGS